MAKARVKASTNPLADMVAGNHDRALSEISGAIAALGNVTSARSEQARDHLERAEWHLSEARELAIETFEQDYRS